jgi:soluble lytic murein transglycosylase-like protein
MRIATLALAMALVPAVAAPEIVVLRSGGVLKVSRWRVDSGSASLELKGGGEIGLAASALWAILPDELPDDALVPADLRSLVRQIAEREGLDPGLVLALVGVESGFRAEALSPKGAQGLMQLMPATAATYGVVDPFDPQANVQAGVRHLRLLLERYGGDTERALAAYNAGEGAVERHRGVPPFAETRAYVRKVLAAAREERGQP